MEIRIFLQVMIKLDISKDRSEAMSTLTPYSLSFLLTLFNRSFHEQSKECHTENNQRLEQHQKVEKTIYFLFAFLHATPDSLGLGNWGTWHRC